MHQVCVYSKDGEFLGYFAGWGEGRLLLSPTGSDAKDSMSPSWHWENGTIPAINALGYRASTTYNYGCGSVTGKMKVAAYASFRHGPIVGPRPTRGWVTPSGVYEYLSYDLGVNHVLDGRCPATVFDNADDALKAVAELGGSARSVLLLPME